MHPPRDRDFRANFLLGDRHGRPFDPRDYALNDPQLHQQQHSQQQSTVRSISYPQHHQRDHGSTTPLSTASSSDLDATALLPPPSSSGRKKHRGGGGLYCSSGGRRKLGGCQLTSIWFSVIFLLFCGFFGVGLYLHGERHLHIAVFDSIGKYLLSSSPSSSLDAYGKSASVCSHDDIVMEVTKNPRMRITTRRQATNQRPEPVCVTPR